MNNVTNAYYDTCTKFATLSAVSGSILYKKNMKTTDWFHITVRTVIKHTK